MAAFDLTLHKECVAITSKRLLRQLQLARNLSLAKAEHSYDGHTVAVGGERLGVLGHLPHEILSIALPPRA